VLEVEQGPLNALLESRRERIRQALIDLENKSVAADRKLTHF